MQITDIGLNSQKKTLSIVYTFANIFNDVKDIDAVKK